MGTSLEPVQVLSRARKLKRTEDKRFEGVSGSITKILNLVFPLLATEDLSFLFPFALLFLLCFLIGFLGIVFYLRGHWLFSLGFKLGRFLLCMITDTEVERVGVREVFALLYMILR